MIHADNLDDDNLRRRARTMRMPSCNQLHAFEVQAG